MIKDKRIITKEIADIRPPVIIQHHPNIQQTKNINVKTMDDMYVLAATIWGEGRSEGDIGMHAILNVILNRSNGNINEAAKISLKSKQITFWNNVSDPYEYAKRIARMNREGKRTLDKIRYEEALVLVDEARNHKLKDITKGATFYYNRNIIKPNWSKTMVRTAVIGKHYFYKPKKETLREYIVDTDLVGKMILKRYNTKIKRLPQEDIKVMIENLIVEDTIKKEGYIGTTNTLGDVNSVFSKDVMIDTHNWRSYTNKSIIYYGWRFLISTGELYWDQPIDHVEKLIKETTHDHIEKKGYVVKKDRNRFANIYNENIKVMVKKLIMEIIKEKINNERAN